VKHEHQSPEPIHDIQPVSTGTRLSRFFKPEMAEAETDSLAVPSQKRRKIGRPKNAVPPRVVQPSFIKPRPSEFHEGLRNEDNKSAGPHQLELPPVANLPGEPRSRTWSGPRLFDILPGDVETDVAIFNTLTGSTKSFRAVFSSRFPYSMVHTSVLEDLGLMPLNLNPMSDKSTRFIRPLAVIRPRQFVGLAMKLNGLCGAPDDAILGHFILLEDSVPPEGPGLYLGQPFLDEHFGGELPRLNAGNRATVEVG